MEFLARTELDAIARRIRLEHFDLVSVRRRRNDRQPRQQDPQDLPHRNASHWKFTVPSPPRPLPRTAHDPSSSSPPPPSPDRHRGRFRRPPARTGGLPSSPPSGLLPPPPLRP